MKRVGTKAVVRAAKRRANLHWQLRTAAIEGQEAGCDAAIRAHVPFKGRWSLAAARKACVGRPRIAMKGTTRSGMPWRLAACLIALYEEVELLAPRRSTCTDGSIGDAAHQSRDSDHNPWVMDGNTGIVRAIDITHDPLNGCDAGRIVGALAQSRDSRIAYIIWNRRILSSTVRPWTWRPYNGPNPHTAHFHISVAQSKPLYDDRRAWAIAAG